MPVPVHREPDSGPPYERCCFCRRQTSYWTSLFLHRTPGQQVACCPECAKVKEPKDVPTKDAWFDQERALEPRPLWCAPTMARPGPGHPGAKK